MYSRDRLSSNTNSNNNVSMTRHQTRCKPLLPSKQKDHLQRKSSTEDTRSVRKDPPPPYHYSILGHPYPSTIAPNLQPNGSGFVDSAARPSRERRREGRARERVGGQWSPRTLPRSQSLERFRSSIRDPLHTSPEQLSYGHSQYQSVGGREKSQPTECARAPSPTPSRRQQYSSSEMVRQSMERNKSPALRRSHSFSHHHSKPSREYHDNQSTQQHYSSSLYKDITKLTSPRLPRHDHTLSDWSHTPSPPSFPCSVSSSNPSLQQTHTRPSKAPPPLASSDYSTASQTSRVAPHSFYSSPSPTSHSSSPTGSGGSSRTPVKLPPSPALRHSPRSETTSSLSTLSSLPSSHISVADSGHRQPRNNPTTSTTPTTTSSPSPSAKVVDKKEFPESGGRVGLVNLGNTCFMNSMLQCLGQTGEMAAIFLNMQGTPSSKSLVRAYSELMQQMWRDSGSDTSSNMLAWSTPTSVIHPRALKDAFSRKNPQFSGFNQHDSQEFMRFLVSGLHEDLKQPLKTKPSVPTDPVPEQWWEWYRELERSQLLDVFVGQLRSSLTCLTCQHCSMTFDPFWELSVSLPRRSPTSYSSYSSHGVSSYSSGSGSSSSGVDLHDCLKIFTREEKMEGDEKPYCERCQSLEPGKKKMTIQRLPPVLIIHLKRFSGYGHRSKLDTSVTIPHTLDISSYISSPSQHPSETEYELYAVSNHSGTVYFGHYTALCKHYSTNKWFSYNDSHVSQLKVQTPTFSSSTAYVLFYRQVKKKKTGVTRC